MGALHLIIALANITAVAIATAFLIFDIAQTGMRRQAGPPRYRPAPRTPFGQLSQSRKAASVSLLLFSLALFALYASQIPGIRQLFDAPQIFEHAATPLLNYWVLVIIVTVAIVLYTRRNLPTTTDISILGLSTILFLSVAWTFADGKYGIPLIGDVLIGIALIIGFLAIISHVIQDAVATVALLIYGALKIVLRIDTLALVISTLVRGAATYIQKTPRVLAGARERARDWVNQISEPARFEAWLRQKQLGFESIARDKDNTDRKRGRK